MWDGCAVRVAGEMSLIVWKLSTLRPWVSFEKIDVVGCIQGNFIPLQQVSRKMNSNWSSVSIRVQRLCNLSEQQSGQVPY